MFDFRNGKSLMDLLVPKGLAHAATSFVESLKINSITEKARRNRRVVIKRRNVYGERGAALINFYFRAADIPIRYLSNAREWRRWEARCFQMLNGDRFRAKVRGSRTITLDKLPGDNLWDHMNRGTLRPRMLTAAGSEYRRAHHCKNEEFGSAWSHGDASMTNVIYNEKTGRARLIDFEIRHEKSLPATARHADDLLVFLLCVVPSANWNLIARSRSIPRAKDGDLRLAARERDRECRRSNRGNVRAKIWQRRFLPECREGCPQQGSRFPALPADRERRRPRI